MNSFVLIKQVPDQSAKTGINADGTIDRAKYHEENHHIQEFSADVCRECIATYDKLDRPTPCVADCTAEVHRVDRVQGQRVHSMSLENCIQCRTCEIICPQLNLRVNPSYEGSGPDFFGL